MKTLNKVFLILFVSLAASVLFAENDLSFGYRNTKTEIDTFVQKVEGAGDLTATVQAADGGFVTVSRIDHTTFVVRKMKLSGQRQWERRLNFINFVNSGITLNQASINGITQTTDGGFVLAGQVGCVQGGDCYGLGGVNLTESHGFDTNNSGFTFASAAILIKLRPNGTIAWKKSLHLPIGYDYLFASVSPAPDGGVIATGRRLAAEFDISQRVFIARFSAAGDFVWEKSFGTIMDSFGDTPFVIRSIATSDSGVIVAFPRPSRSVDVMKIDNSGNVVWQKLLDLAFGFQSLGATFEGGAVLTGTVINSKELKVVVLKTDGALSWKAEYSFQVPGNFRSISSPVQTHDGGYVITGSNGFIAKIDSSRKVAFQNTFGASGKSVFATADGGFFLFGSADKGSDIVVLKLNSEGTVPGCHFFGSLGPTTRTSFGPLKIGQVKIIKSNDLSFEPFDFELTSAPTNNRVSTVCQ